MVTYVNDLRLSELATGEGSGTWGTTTNTNLELIGESLGYGTEAITTNADTHTTTVADGSTDPGRAMYIKYTGTLDSACTITIGPNTLSRVHIIENATSGSQNIIIKQGSGAEVTIPNGFVKAVYLDGAGSGAAVTEAFADLSIGPNLRIGNAAAEDTAIVFDGNAQDFYIGLDDSADDLIIGLGSTVGTTPIISVDENKDVAIPDGGLTITTSDNTAQLALVSTDEDANIAPLMQFYRNSSSPADNDQIGRIEIYGENDADEKILYGEIVNQIKDASDGSEDGRMEFNVMTAGTAIARMDILPTETVFNQGGYDVDFRVESDNNANMMFLDAGNDAVAIGHSATIAMAGERHELEVFDTNFSCISAATFRNGSDGANITLGHSRSGTIGTQTVLQDGDTMGGINFVGSDGTDMASYGARIFVEVDGNPGSNDMPGQIKFATTADGASGASTRMTIRATGDILQGAASQVDPSSFGMSYGIGSASGGGFYAFDTTSSNEYTLFGHSGTSGYVHNRASGDLLFGVNNTTKMTLKADGQVNVSTMAFGTTLRSGGTSTGQLAIEYSGATENGLKIRDTGGNAGGGAVRFVSSSSLVGSITTTTSATTYSTTSDYRLKDNVTYDWDGLTRLKQLKPARFTWKTDSSNTLVDGFLAHEAQTVVPESVTGTHNETENVSNVVLNAEGNVIDEGVTEDDWQTGKNPILWTDDDMNIPEDVSVGDVKTPARYSADTTWKPSHTKDVHQGIDQSKLVPLLVKAVQELEAKVAALEEA